MLNEPMIFEDIDLANALHKAKVWLDTYAYDSYIPTHCLVTKEELDSMDVWKVEIFYRMDE
jgi:hypothetical protein